MHEGAFFDGESRMGLEEIREAGNR
jgi:hypothetical protein